MEDTMETTERTEMPEGGQILPMMYHLMASYEKRCQPLCKQFDLPQTAVDILMFLANHPGCRTASEVSRYRRIQPSLVSFHVDRLVKAGYLERIPAADSRRKIYLEYTVAAEPLIQAGHKIQQEFMQDITKEISEADQRVMERCMKQIAENIRGL